MRADFRRYPTFPLALLFLFSTLFLQLPMPERSQAQTPHFAELRERFEEGEIFAARFDHEYRDSYTGEESLTGGEIWIGREMYRVESQEQIMLVRGGESRVYDPLRNRLLISEYVEEEDDFAPSRMLQGVDETYSVREESVRGGTRIILTSEDPFSVFKRVEITLNSLGVPERIEARDQVDNLLITRFRNGRFSRGEESLFELQVPADAERIDLRY